MHFVQFKQRDRRLQMLITKLVVSQLHAAGRNQIPKIALTNNAIAATLPRAINQGERLLGRGLGGGGTIIFRIIPDELSLASRSRGSIARERRNLETHSRVSRLSRLANAGCFLG
jgi:hypothetical protein